MISYVLIFFDAKKPQSEKELADILKRWSVWFDSIGKNLVDKGGPFSRKATAWLKPAAKALPGETSTGYCIITAPDMAKALADAKKTPVVQDGGRAEVYEVYKLI